jgi:Terminase small subunit.
MKEIQFCLNYLVDLNPLKAYKATYKQIPPNHKQRYGKTYEEIIDGFFSNPDINKFLQEERRARAVRLEAKADEVVKHLKDIAGAKVIDAFESITTDEEGKTVCIVKNIEDMPPELQYAIEKIKVSSGGQVEITLSNRLKALELLGKHIGMFEDKISVNGDMTVNNPFKNLSEEELKRMIGE